ncbi:MAG TPA: response regulator [Spirochaetia bacterium]|nr:MAG: histidine kinase [Spirochaetes bacterium GWB1_36_13]HCL56300.1 response regulator [Spirochaetia bacterium]
MEKEIQILVVEDEAITAMLLQTQLKKIGYLFLTHVTTGEKAILSAKQSPPDLILMDIGLAGEIDGIEAAAVIKSKADIPIIFITGYEDNTIRQRAQTVKPLEYLIKPLSMYKLKTIIDQYFG